MVLFVLQENWTNLKEKIIAVLKNRCFYIGVIVFLVMLLLIGRLYHLQIVNGDEYNRKADRVIGNIVSLAVDTPRGNIYDRNGILLATTRASYKVQMTNVNKEQSFRDEMYLKLIELFEANDDVYTNGLARYLASPDEWGSQLKGEDKSQERANWINHIAIKKSDRDGITTARDAFAYLRNVRFKLDASYTDEQAYKIMIIRYQTFRYGLSYLTPTTLATDVSEETMETIEARYLEFPGVTTEETYFREYVGTEPLSHVIGYVRAISSEEYEVMKEEGYANDDIIGKVGIEKAAEALLRGEKGVREVYLEDGMVREYSYQAPVPGNDLYLTIDYNLQKAVLETLERNIQKIAASADGKNNFGDAAAGAVVVMNVKTGEVLAMANYPTYDNSIFLQPSSNQEAQQAITDLFQDPTSPSLNRAAQGLYPVGSTIKPLIAVAGLESGATDVNREVVCRGIIEFNNHTHTCLSSHGSISMIRAISESCNIYFQQIAVDMGIETVDQWAKTFGLAEKTGIEISEYTGYRSNPETMKIKESDIYHIWSDSDTAQTAIGQLYTLFTPLQLCRYAAALGNGGYLRTPYLIDSVLAKDGTVISDNSEKQAAYSKIDVSAYALSQVKAGMVDMANRNSQAKEAFKGLGQGFVAAKTGTPETGMEAFGHSSHSLVICYAPADDPEIAISIVIEHGTWGSNSLPIAGDVIKAYFGETYIDSWNHARQEGYTWQSLIR